MVDPRGPAYNTPPIPARTQGAIPTAVVGGGGGYLRVRQKQADGSWRIVRVHQSKLTPAHLAAARQNGLNGPVSPSKPTGGVTNRLGGGAQQTPVPAKPAGFATPGATTRPATPNTIDPRDGIYQAELAQYAYDRDQAIAGINAERATLPSLYNRGFQDIRTGYNRDRFDSNAELAARGLVRSGEYQRRGADRQMQQVRHVADLDRQYGTGAQSLLTQRLTDIQRQYALQQQGALASAKDRYASSNPASTYIFANT